MSELKIEKVDTSNAMEGSVFNKEPKGKDDEKEDRTHQRKGKNKDV
jgi:hypothetical protein